MRAQRRNRAGGKGNAREQGGGEFCRNRHEGRQDEREHCRRQRKRECMQNDRAGGHYLPKKTDARCVRTQEHSAAE